MSSFRVRVGHALRPFRQASRISRVLVAAGLVITVLFVLIALFGADLYQYDGTQYRVEQADGSFEQLPQRDAPSADHPMGTTQDRFDVVARIIGGARVALQVVLGATVLAMVIGVPLGLLSGYRGGKLDRVVVTVMDAIYVFPPLLLAIVVALLLRAYIDPGVPSVAAAVGVVYIPQYFRVVRNHTMSIKQEPYVEAARSLGAKQRTVIFRYVFFNVIQSVPVIFTVNAADAILTLASLGFLGYGVPPPAPEWGQDISRARLDVSSGVWWTAFWPGAAIVMLVGGLTLLGEGLNDIINPLLRARGAAGKRLDDVTADPRGSGDAPDDPGSGPEPTDGDRTDPPSDPTAVIRGSDR